MDHPVESVARPRLRASRTLAAVLSFVAPGTGQLLTGRVKAGLLFLIPLVILVLAAIGLASGDRVRILEIAVQPGIFTAILVLDVAILCWRVAAIVDAWWSGSAHDQRTRLGTVTVVALLTVTIGTHVLIGTQVVAARDTVAAVFQEEEGFEEEDDGFGEFVEPTPNPTPTPYVVNIGGGPTLDISIPPTPTPAPTPRPSSWGPRRPPGST